MTVRGLSERRALRVGARAQRYQPRLDRNQSLLEPSRRIGSSLQPSDDLFGQRQAREGTNHKRQCPLAGGEA